MRPNDLPKCFPLALAFALAFASNGCTFDVKLDATPAGVQVGLPVDFEVTVTNRSSNCPVGIPIAILIPFVPKDHLISKIEDDDFRGFLSEAVDEFCTEGDFFDPPPGAEASCDFQEGDMVCTLSGFGDIPVAPQGNLPLNGSAKNSEEVTCESDGATITCRVPSALVQTAQAGEQPQEGILDQLLCVEADTIGICTGVGLLPGGSATGHLELVVDDPGVYRNWVVAFPTVHGGVCSGGLLNRPLFACDPDGENQCLFGSNGECLEGICVSGDDDDDDDSSPAGEGTGAAIGGEKSPVGLGCDPSPVGQGGGAIGGVGECTDCQECDFALDFDVACTTVTASFSAPAPAMSTWGLAALALALFAIAAVGLRRVRQNETD